MGAVRQRKEREPDLPSHHWHQPGQGGQWDQSDPGERQGGGEGGRESWPRTWIPRTGSPASVPTQSPRSPHSLTRPPSFPGAPSGPFSPTSPWGTERT